MKITLYDSVGTAIIIGCKSGVIYSNQTGGTACLQPEYEGVLIPIANTIGIPNLNLVSPEKLLNCAERPFALSLSKGLPERLHPSRLKWTLFPVGSVLAQGHC
ncbi:hypothetical protein EUZ85_18880 [Hahella sp. KA22]|uniref:DUF6210 family protein n=1 Tax=Hahella sp. KA22 TaxID=1628392 RepID=UPI000FDE040B|nr:DUF6210 family protein [Hahella sp. KA22]AZZ92678.1 hypothetical protein ENC22_16305 [Hahella sp. KA22]QAY56051.1 hypothetical protein EUZ85_18880 [Hahella sp. KA22]